ncbi:uncharacterized protein [Temnothorax nylanderi]|uniref:uncharacterized protein n=1 Tax=Temnothorax nylanderi TaxID=102681 RepID=UPI003A89FAB7
MSNVRGGSESTISSVLKVKDKNGQFVEGRALLDNGSQSNFISKKFMSKLGLKGSKTQIHINGTNQQVSRALRIVNLNITSRFDSFSTDLKCVVLPCITKGLPAVKIDAKELDIPSNVRLADPKFHTPREVDLLIGAERFWDLICVGQIKLGKNKPTLQKSMLGWIISGVVEGQSDEVLQTSCHLSMEENLCNTVNRFWQLEDCLTQESLTDEDKYVEEFFKKTYSRDAEGRFIVKLPVNQKILDQLGDSESNAMKRLLSIKRKFKKDPELKAEYIKFMSEYLELGHMRPVSESASKTKRVFLFHQAVVKEGAATTKTRVVFDASSKDSKGFLLNDALYKGPTVFWREAPEALLQILELLTVTYGQKAYAFLAIKCLQELAELEKKRFPIASEVVFRDFYVDDLLSGAATVQGVKDLKKQITELLALEGFELHKWNLNIPLDSRKRVDEDNILVDLCKEQESRLLGILWDPSRDVLHYKSPIVKLENKVTKRVMLSEVSRLFGPLGLVAL